MADALDNVMEEVTALLGAMAGINQAPEYPPEGINDPPMVVTRYVRHVPSYSLSYTHMITTAYANVYVSRSVLPEAEKKARPYVLLGLAAIAGSVTLNSDASHCLVTEIIGPGPLPYQGGETYYGVQFVLEIKLTYAQLTTVITAA
jgi:hypothetical protein